MHPGGCLKQSPYLSEQALCLALHIIAAAVAEPEAMPFGAA